MILNHVNETLWYRSETFTVSSTNCKLKEEWREWKIYVGAEKENVI